LETGLFFCWWIVLDSFFGGSDAGAICGFNPYRSAMQVYHDKTSDEIENTDKVDTHDTKDQEDTEQM